MMKNRRGRSSVVAILIMLLMIGGMVSGVSARPLNEGTAMDGEYPANIYIQWDREHEVQAENLKEGLVEEFDPEIFREMEAWKYHQYPEWLVKAMIPYDEITDSEEDLNPWFEEMLEIETEEEIRESMIQFMKLSKPLGLSSRELDYLLEDTAFEGLGSSFRKGALKSEINELYLITEAIKESKEHNDENTEGILIDEIANSSVEPREGYNIFGIGATDNNRIKSAAVFAYQEEWFSIEEAIIGGAAWLGENKIHREEKPQDTLFKELWQYLEEPRSVKTDIAELEDDLREIQKTHQWQRQTLAEFYEALNLYTYYIEIPEFSLEEVPGDERVTEWPVPERKIISSGFGLRRDPFEDEMRFHYGLDIPGNSEDPIVAVYSGVVTVSRRGGSYGNWIEIDHGEGWTTRYAHNKENLVTVGEEVEKGQVIALLGSTGRSTGPHLHFEVRKEGKAIDPLHWLAQENLEEEE